MRPEIGSAIPLAGADLRYPLSRVPAHHAVQVDGYHITTIVVPGRGVFVMVIRDMVTQTKARSVTVKITAETQGSKQYSYKIF